MPASLRYGFHHMDASQSGLGQHTDAAANPEQGFPLEAGLVFVGNCLCSGVARRVSRVHQA